MATLTIHPSTHPTTTVASARRPVRDASQPLRVHARIDRTAITRLVKGAHSTILAWLVTSTTPTATARLPIKADSTANWCGTTA